ELANGGNLEQPFPELTSAYFNGAHTTVQGTLTGPPNSTFTLEFFWNYTCSPSGYGEGLFMLSTNTLTTDALGSATFSFNFNLGAAPFFAVTATDPDNNTSAFSNCVQAIGPEMPGESTSGWFRGVELGLASANPALTIQGEDRPLANVTIPTIAPVPSDVARSPIAPPSDQRQPSPVAGDPWAADPGLTPDGLDLFFNALGKDLFWGA